MESLAHERANISFPNCNKILIFGKYTFFITYFQNISVNPIISKKYFLWRHTLVLYFRIRKALKPAPRSNLSLVLITNSPDGLDLYLLIDEHYFTANIISLCQASIFRCVWQTVLFIIFYTSGYLYAERMQYNNTIIIINTALWLKLER